ncbi:MAG: DUF350 domain-containing protein [Candidatus Latescibacteria bacterium]|nr:DUF350 domain-containing protein [Candidatus Latescibacterota bacterium]
MVEEYLIPMVWTLVYIFEAFALLWVAKLLYVGLYRRVDIKHELFANDNVALAVSLGGYLLGIIIALGGSLGGPSAGWQLDLVHIALYGVVSIVLLLVASLVCEKILLPHFDNTKEVVQDHNLGTAFVEAGLHIGNGLIILAIVQGDGPWWSGLAFWVLAQIVLVVAGLLYEAVTNHHVHREIERDNAAVGLAFGGSLVGLANIVSVAAGGDFTGWGAGLTDFALYAGFGLLMLAIVKKLTDLVLAPGIKLAAEQTQEKPNIGAGLLEAVGYIGGSMLVGWVL